MSLRSWLLLPLGLIALAGCTNPFDGGASTIDKGYQSGAPATLTAVATTANFDQNTTSAPINLPYTGQGDVQPISCEIGSLSNLIPASACVCANGACAVQVTAALNFNGPASFEFRLTDNQGRFSNWAAVNVTVNHVNQPPTIGPIAATSILADETSSPIAVPVGDIDSTLNCATGLSVVSSNPTVIPVSGVQFTGSPPSCLMTITPGVGQVGVVNLDLTITDGALTTSAPVTITVNPNPPAAPTHLTATYATGPSVALNWMAATGPGPMTYTVYRSTLSGSGYAPVTGCSAVSATTCSDLSFTDGTDYYYVVRATNLTATSTYSNEASINPKLPTAATLSKTSVTGGVSLAWSGSTGTAPLSYTVRRSTASGGPYLDIVTGLVGGTYSDTSATPGTTYYYVVATVNAGGSINSNEITATALEAFNLTSVSVNGSGSVSLIWPSVNGASSYRVKYGTTSGTYPTLVTATGTSPQSITGLTPGLTYYFRVYAENSTDAIASTNELSAVPMGGFSISSVVATSGQAVVSWGPSAGAASYQVKYGTSTGSYTTTFSTNATSPTTVTGLPNNVTYYFMVTAVNPSGTLNATSEVSALPIDVPSAPTNLTLAATPGQVEVSWTAATGPGTITYDVRRGTATGTYTTIASSLSGTSFTDTSVLDATNYYYVVRAKNAGGLGPYATETTVMPISTFGLTSAQAGSSRVTLNWHAATGATRYTVWRSTSAAPELTGAPVMICTDLTATTCNDTSVTNGTTYYYVVIAANTDYPTSTSRSISDEVTVTPLVSPWNFITAKTASVEFSWLNNLLTPTPISYTIRYSTTLGGAETGADLPGCTNLSHPTNTCLGTGLTNGTRYYFVLVADQGGGVTYVSDEVNARPISALTVTSAVANSSTQVTINWNDVVGETGYTVNYGTSSGSYPSGGGSAAQNATSRVVTGLTGGTTYYFRVTASNGSGFIYGTPEVSVTTPVFPSVPSGLSLDISQAGALDLTWAASTGTGPLTYEVFRTTTSGSTYTSLAAGISGTSFQDTSATPGTTYYYVVRATGPGGTTAYSSEVSGIALSAFTLSGLTATDDSTAVVSFGSSTGATAYTVKYGTASGVYGTVVTTSAVSPATISGLSGGQTYYVMVTATNATGELDATAEMTLTTPVRPSAPVPTLAITQAAQLDLSWSAVTGTTPITYSVFRSTTSGSGFTALAGCSAQVGLTCVDTGVSAGTLYYYRVVASGPGGSTTSAEVSGRPLGAFSITAAAATSDTSATVSWAASAGAVSYTLAYGTSSGTYGSVVTTSATSPQAVSGLTSNTTYYFMVTAVNAVGQLRATAEYSLTTPVRPSALVLAKTGVNAGVTLSWNQPSGTLPMSYDVKRSTVSGSGYTTISTAQSLTGYTDATAAYGTTYYYIVTATNPGGSTDSNEISATPIATFNQTSATITASESVTIAWPAVSGASAYTLAYGINPGGPYSTTVSTSATSPRTVTGLTGGTAYYFKVTATNATESQPSTNELSATAIGVFAITSVNGGHQSATVTWPGVSGATSYDIGYGTSTGSYTTTLTNQTSPVTITGLTNATTYYFRVFAKNASGSAPSSAEVSRSPGLTLTKSAGDAQTAVVDTTLPTPIRVSVADSVGTPIPGVAVNWSVTGGGGTLSSCAATTDASGYATCDWKIGTVTGANTVQASINSGGTSVNFTATGTNAPAATLSVTGIASTVTAGATLSMTVRALDTYGNTAINYTGTVGFTSNDAAAVLPSNYTFTGGDAGQRTFNAVSLRTAGSRTITATDTVTSSITGSHTSVTVNAAAADHLVLVAGDAQTAVVGQSLATNPRVRLLDAYNNPVAGTTLTFTPSAGTVGSATVITDASGEASTSFTLGTTAGAQTLTVARQTTALPGTPATITFNETAVADAAASLVFSTAPSASTVSLVAFAQQPVIDIVDAYGNRVLAGPDSTALITLNLQTGTGTLGGTLTRTAVNGRASFAGQGLNIDLIGTNKVLRATKSDTSGGGGTGPLSVDSGVFTITHAPAAQLAYGTEPGNGTAGTALGTQPVLRILDASGNLVSTGASATANVTLAIANNPGTGTLSGTLTRAAVGGVATFTGLSINKVGTGYTLNATSGALTNATSAGFDITFGAATKLVYNTQPGNGVAGSALSVQPVIYVTDANDNLVTTSTASVTIAIANNSGGGTLSGTVTVSAVGGIATFTGLSIEKTGAAYTVAVTSVGLTGATSSGFNITPASATKLAFGTQPGNGVAGASLSTQPIVRVLDSFDNLVTSANDSVTLAIGTNPGTGTLSGTTTVAATAGIATFTGLSINKIGTGYTLSASASGLTGATSSTFNITPGAAAKLAFGTQPGNGIAGTALSAQPVVRILDANDNLTTSTANVTVAINTNPGGGTLSGTATVAAVAGVATYTGLSINKTGVGYDLITTSGALTAATSSGFDITPSTPTKLAFGTQPGNGIAGAALSSQPVVRILDAFDNLVTSATDNVSLAITTNPGSGTLSGTSTIAAVAGVATFTGLSIEKSGTGYRLGASAAGLSSATSTTFNIVAGAASKLAFATQPGNGVAGSALSTQPVVQILDANDNVVTTATDTVTLAIGTNPGTGTLGGTTAVAAVAGVATFTGLNINKTGTGYTLTAAVSGLTAATSSAFNITPGAAAKLAFGTQPGNGVAGAALSTQPVVRILDANDNLTASTANVTLAIGTNPGSGTLSGTLTVAAVSGVATFSGLSINKTGTGYTLGATAGALTAATSSAFNITPGAATKLAFGTQPGNGVAGAALGTQPIVRILDANDNIVTTATDNVTLAIATNPGSGTLSGTATVAAVSGVATFAGLSIEKIGTGYTLSATSGALTAATSNTFNITPGAATKLAFSTQPGNGVAGAALSTQPVVRILDANDNLTTSTANVTLAIGTNPGAGTLSGTVTVAAVSGVATFTGLNINKTGVGYTLAATSGVLTGATSTAFDVTPGAAAKLAFSTQPGNGVAGAALGTQPVVRILDANDNLTASTANVTVAIGTNAGGGTLSGTVTVAAVAGVATFTGLSIEKIGTGYTLSATSGVLTGATSNAFNITPGAATKLAFGTQPGNGVAGSALSTQPVVRILDANDNLTTSTANVTVAIGTNAGGGTLSGTATVAAISGVATFSGLSIEKIGTGYTLSATSGVLTGATSNAFNVTAGAATKLAFSTQPGNGVAGAALSTQPVVRILDANDNLTTSTANVTLAIGTNPGTGTLSGTVTVAAVSGVATFTGLNINKTGTGYTLSATSGVLTGATSTSFNITPGAAAKLAFSTQPGNGVAGSALSTQPVVRILDANDNLTASTANVTIAIGTNAGGGTLSGTATVAAVSGVATFSGLSIEKTGTGYTLAATSGALTGATSSTFNITPAAATKLAFGTQPGNGVAGSALATQPVVRVLDTYDNIVTTYVSNVTVAIGTNPGSGTLSGTATVAAVSGVATFSGLSINKVGTGYTLTTTSGALTGATSNAFNITPGAATKLAFTAHPSSSVAGAAFGTQPVAQILDANDNVVTGSSANVTIAIANNAGGGTLSGTLTVAASSGVVSYSGLSINKTGTAYTLTVTSGALTAATSNAFNITPGAATKIGFSTQPGNGVAGSALATQPVVQILDTNDNLVTSATNSVTLAIGTNPGSGTLSGTLTVAAVSGVATFSGLSINKTGTGYTLAGTSAGLTGATSTAFNITPGTATKLAFGTQPGNGIAGAALGTQPVVRILDANDNLVTTATNSITLSITTNPGSGTLSGTAVLAATAGVATYSGLSIEKVGTGYVLGAAASGLTGVNSSTFTITHAAASQMVFTTQPSGATAGVVFTQQPVVEVQDAFGNRVITGADAGAILSMSITSGTGTLTTTTSQTTVLGIATWSDLKIDAFGTKVITATKPNMTGSGGVGVLTVASNSFVNATNPPAVPTGLAANTGDAAVAMSWTAVSGATSYNIMRGTVSGSLTQIATSGTNSYTDTTPTNGTTYYYAIQAVNAGGTSASSSEIAARPIATSTISSVVVSAAGALTITWSAGAGAANYEVRYATTSGGAATGTAGCSTTAPTVTCAVTGLTAGTTYYFAVVSTNAVGGGATTTSAAAMGVPLATPSLSLAPLSRQITPTFSAAGATSYNLGYGTSTGSYTTTVTGATSGSAVTGLINGTTYYFRVTAVNAYGSLNSTEQSSAPNGPQAFSIASGTPGNASFALTWGASTGATTYNVRYGTTSGTYGTTFATGVVGTSSTVTGLTNGTTYYFMVTAVNANGTQDSTVEWTGTPAQPTLAGTANLVSPTMGAGFTARVPFTLGGLSTFTCAGNVTATSSNSAVFNTAAITISGTYPNCLMSATVGAGTTGTTTVALTATYGSATASASYTIQFTTAVSAAYSVRRLVLGYNGNIMRVRHGTNNAEGDIAFDNSNILSASSIITITSAGTSGYSIGQTMAFSAFYGTANVFVRTWYDQSSNARDVTNATTTTQPRLVNAGTIETLSGKPSVNYTTLLMTLASSARIVTTINEYAVVYIGASAANNSTPFSLNGADSGQRLAMHAPEGASIMSDIPSSGTGYARQTGTWSVGYNTAFMMSQLNSVTSNVRQIRINTTVNATMAATNWATNVTQGTLQLGGTLYGAGYAFTGKFSEFMVLGSNIVTTNGALEAGSKAYFGTP